LLGVSVGTSKSQLHRARMTLRTQLNQTPDARREAAGSRPQASGAKPARRQAAGE
jgi:hypothetical protein